MATRFCGEATPEVSPLRHDFDAIKDELAGSATLDEGLYILDWIQARPLGRLEERRRVFCWLAERGLSSLTVLSLKIASLFRL